MTKYRYKVFSNTKLQKLCEVFLHEAAKRHRFQIEDMEVAPDHVHVIAKLRPSMSPAKAVNVLKGFSARMLFMTEEQTLKSFYWKQSGKRNLWGDGKFMGSVGHITLEKAKEYVKNHKTHHAKFLLIRESPPFMVGEEVKYESKITLLGDYYGRSTNDYPLSKRTSGNSTGNTRWDEYPNRDKICGV